MDEGDIIRCRVRDLRSRGANIWTGLDKGKVAIVTKIGGKEYYLVKVGNTHKLPRGNGISVRTTVEIDKKLEAIRALMLELRYPETTQGTSMEYLYGAVDELAERIADMEAEREKAMTFVNSLEESLEVQEEWTKKLIPVKNEYYRLRELIAYRKGELARPESTRRKYRKRATKERPKIKPEERRYE